MNTLPQNTVGFDAGDLENPFALAIAVLRERVRLLPRDDQNDLYSLLPALLGDDEEERSSAGRAVKEILDQAKGKVHPIHLPSTPGESLKGWVQFVSKRIFEARTQAGITQDELATRTSIPQSHICRLEAGMHSPTFKTLEKIAAALNVPVAFFDPST